MMKDFVQWLEEVSDEELDVAISSAEKEIERVQRLSHVEFGSCLNEGLVCGKGNFYMAVSQDYNESYEGDIVDVVAA